MKHSRLLFELALILCLSACGTRIFNANFDSDEVGSPPNTSPPGDPVGDMILIESVRAGLSNPAEVVGIGAIDSQSLRYSNIDLPSLVREVKFISKEINPTAPQFWVLWEGRLQNFTDATPPLEFIVGSFEIGNAWLVVDNGQFLVGNSTRPVEFEPIGNYFQDVNHTILIKIDNRAGTYTLWIFQEDTDELTVGPKPLRSRSVLRERILMINMRFGDTSHTTASYLIDNIAISETEPERMK